MSKPPSNIIYGLIDPTTQLIFYVGCSSRGLQRPREHRKSGFSKCREWVKRLQNDGLDYEIVVLEYFDSSTPLPDAERWWIAYGRGCGWPLTNQTAGGGLNTAAIRERIESKKRERHLATKNYEQTSEARKLNACILLYKDRGAESALDAAKGFLAPTYLEWFEVAVIEHYLTICKELPPRLACPCGHVEPFSDDVGSLLTAVIALNCHFREIAARREAVSEPGMGDFSSKRWRKHWKGMRRSIRSKRRPTRSKD